jgi:hypothetical protein
MAKVMAMYGQPGDPAAFDRHSDSKHLLLADTLEP